MYINKPSLTPVLLKHVRIREHIHTVIFQALLGHAVYQLPIFREAKDQILFRIGIEHIGIRCQHAVNRHVVCIINSSRGNEHRNDQCNRDCYRRQYRSQLFSIHFLLLFYNFLACIHALRSKGSKPSA